jgi:hypothetical protein
LLAFAYKKDGEQHSTTSQDASDESLGSYGLDQGTNELANLPGLSNAAAAAAAEVGKASAAAAATSDSVICVEDSQDSQTAQGSMDVKADDGADQEQDQELDDQRPKLNGPERFTPVNYPLSRQGGNKTTRKRKMAQPDKPKGRRGRPPGSSKHHLASNPYLKTYPRTFSVSTLLKPCKYSTKKKPSNSKPTAFMPLAVTPTPAMPALATALAAAVAAAETPAAAAAAGAPAGPEADLTAAALGLQLADQYTELLQQVQALLDSLNPSQVRVTVLDTFWINAAVHPDQHGLLGCHKVAVNGG